jgi:hypothetical protein
MKRLRNKRNKIKYNWKQEATPKKLLNILATGTKISIRRSRKPVSKNTRYTPISKPLICFSEWPQKKKGYFEQSNPEINQTAKKDARKASDSNVGYSKIT